jgi:hypothetical protein
LRDSAMIFPPWMGQCLSDRVPPLTFPDDIAPAPCGRRIVKSRRPRTASAKSGTVGVFAGRCLYAIPPAQQGESTRGAARPGIARMICKSATCHCPRGSSSSRSGRSSPPRGAQAETSGRSHGTERYRPIGAEDLRGRPEAARRAPPSLTPGREIPAAVGRLTTNSRKATSSAPPLSG